MGEEHPAADGAQSAEAVHVGGEGGRERHAGDPGHSRQQREGNQPGHRVAHQRQEHQRHERHATSGVHCRQHVLAAQPVAQESGDDDAGGVEAGHNAENQAGEDLFVPDAAQEVDGFRQHVLGVGDKVDAEQAGGDAADDVGAGQLPHGGRFEALAPAVHLVGASGASGRGRAGRRTVRVGVAVGVQAHGLRVGAQEEHGQGRGHGRDDDAQQEPDGAPAGQLHVAQHYPRRVDDAHQVGGEGDGEQAADGGSAGGQGGGLAALAAEPAHDQGQHIGDGGGAEAGVDDDGEDGDEPEQVQRYADEAQGQAGVQVSDKGQAGDGQAHDDQAAAEDAARAVLIEQRAHDGLHRAVDKEPDGTDPGYVGAVPAEGGLHFGYEEAESLAAGDGQEGYEEAGGDDVPAEVQRAAHLGSGFGSHRPPCGAGSATARRGAAVTVQS